jgi:hypothetical protein
VSAAIFAPQIKIPAVREGLFGIPFRNCFFQVFFIGLTVAGQFSGSNQFVECG